MEDTRRLIPISIKKLEDNLWNIKIDAGEFYNVEGSLDEIKRALRRIKAKDGAEYGKCRSSKKGTYSSMVGEGDDNLHKINVWKSKVPHSPEEFKKLMEAVIMKQIKLTKKTKPKIFFFIKIFPFKKNYYNSHIISRIT